MDQRIYRHKVNSTNNAIISYTVVLIIVVSRVLRLSSSMTFPYFFLFLLLFPFGAVCHIEEMCFQDSSLSQTLARNDASFRLIRFPLIPWLSIAFRLFTCCLCLLRSQITP